LRSAPTVYIGGVLRQQGLVERKIVHFIVDPRYEKVSHSYDFAVIRLDKPVDENIITPVGLHTGTSTSFPKALTVVGYGHTKQNANQPSNTLQHALVVAQESCVDSKYPDGQVKEFEMLCANAPDYSRDACQGM